MALIFCFALAVPAFASAQTVVSLEFDDGTSDEVAAGTALAAAGTHGTFFINSGRIATSGYMTLAQIQALAAAGNEIGGHTVNHLDLPSLTTDEAAREICNDRVTLLADGFQVSDFAYPFGDTTPAVEQLAAGCGYNSARTIGGVLSPTSCTGCDLSETIPPADPYDTNTPNSITATLTLPQIEALVTQAEPGGGWVQLVMHHVCDYATDTTCDPTYSISPGNLAGLLAWLKTQSVTVETVNQVIGGAVKPGVPGPTVSLPSSGNLLQDSSFTTGPGIAGAPPNPTINDGLPNPDCWGIGGSAGTGALSTDVSLGSPAGASSEQVSVTSAVAPGTDERLFSTQDLGGCAPVAQAGHKYLFSAWEHSTAPLYMEAYLRTSGGQWGYWADNAIRGTDAAGTPVAPNYTQVSWTTPAVPASGIVFDPTDNLSCPCTGISVAVSLRQIGSFTADDLSLADTDTILPSVTLTAPANNSFVAGNQNVTLSATASAPNTGDPTGNGIRQVAFLINSQIIGTSTTPPYQMTWNSGGSTGATITARATDTAGNVTTSPAATVNVDSTPPTSTLTALPGLSNPKTFKVAYTAADNVEGSGLAEVDLYAKAPGASSYSEVATDTSDKASDRFTYTGAGDGAYSFYTLATDKAGNAQSAPANLAQATTMLDSVPPTSNASASALTDSKVLSVSYTASDNSGGSGLADVELFVKAPGASSYSKVATDMSGLSSGAFTYDASAGDGSYSFYTLAADNAGNVESAPANPETSTVLDFIVPASHASASAFSDTPTLKVAYTASDIATGLARVDLYAGGPGALTYRKVASDTTGKGSGTFAYTASAGNGAYSFYTLATSKAGNAQSAPGAPDTTTLFDSVAPSSRVTASALQLSSAMKLSYTAGDNPGGSGLAGVSLFAKAPGATSYTLAASSPSASGTFSYRGRLNGAYSFYTLGTDKAGNVQGVPSTPTISVLDLNAPRALRISTAGQHKGRLGRGDIVTFTYSKAIKPSSVLAGWTGASTSVRVSLTGKHRSMLSVWSAIGRRLLALADPLALGGAYTKSASATFAAKLAQHGSAITVTFRSLISGKMSLTAVTAGTLAWTPSAAATDLAGAKASTRPVTARGPAF